MEDTQDNLSQDNVGDDDSQEQNGGVGVGDAEEQGASQADQDFAAKDDPYSVKKRLGMQAKRHQREMRAMQEQLMHMQAQIGQPSAGQFGGQHSNPYPSPGQPNPPSGTEEERIQKAVRYALQAKEQEAEQAKNAERAAHVQKQYQRLGEEFDKASDKYEDFDDVVRGDAPFTGAIRDALLFVDNPADVAYKLGKNRQELTRISQLHPLDQAREVNKLSFALMGGNSGKSSAPNPNGSNRVMNQIKANPANASSAVTDKTPPSAIRARMKAGTWK